MLSLIIARYKMLNNSDSHTILTNLYIHIYRHCKIMLSLKWCWFDGSVWGVKQPLHTGFLHQCAVMGSFSVRYPPDLYMIYSNTIVFEKHVASWIYNGIGHIIDPGRTI